jgi:hypothetical protein
MSYVAAAEKMEQGVGGTYFYQAPSKAVAVKASSRLTPVAVVGRAVAVTPVVVSAVGSSTGQSGIPMCRQDKLGGKCCECQNVVAAVLMSSRYTKP